MTLAPGDNLGTYRLIRVIGEGGMGVVWEAEQTGLGRRVALKIVRPSLASEPEFRSRFETEARSAASLDHPNVVTVYDSGEIDGHLFMSMALVEGPSLRELIDADGKLSPARSAGIAADVAAGLGAAHSAGLVHRDVKPSNILLSLSQGKAVITDFGIAKVRDATRATSTGQVLGTLNYMAPEQMQGGTVDERADIYSLGTVLYEMLAGTPPYVRDTAPATMFAHVSDPIPKAAAANPEVPAALDDVVTMSMAKQPDARFTSMAQFSLSVTNSLGDDATTVMAAAPVVDDRTKVLYEQLNQTRVDTRRGAPASGKGSPRPKAAGGTAESPKRRVTLKRVLVVTFALALGALFGGGVAVGVPKLLERLTTTSTSISTTTESTTETTTETTTSSDTSSVVNSGEMMDVSGEGYFAQMPAGWIKTPDSYEGKTSGTRFKWTNPDNKDVTAVIETTPGFSGSNLESANSISRGLANASVQSVSLSGDSTAAVINFTSKGRTLDDYFLNVCGTGVAVLGGAPSSEYDSWSSTFWDIANSVGC